MGGIPGAIEIGVTPWLDDWDGPATSLAAQAGLAEELGFHSFWLPESHFTGRSANPAPLLRLAAVAARTRRIRLGTTSYLLPVRHPIQVAEEVAVLDRLSEGRVILGLGRGFRASLFAAFDVPAREKRDRFRSALEVIVGAWRGEPVAWEEDAEGARTPVHVSPRPVQQPHPPLWVAGFGPKAMAQAGELGLPYLASPVEPLARLEENYALHRAALPEGLPGGALAVPVMRTVFTSRDPRVLRAAREGLAQQAAALARAPLVSIRRAAEASLDDWAVVGEPEAVVERIGKYRAALGMTHLIVRGGVPGVPPEAVVDSLRTLAELAPGAAGSP